MKFGHKACPIRMYLNVFYSHSTCDCLFLIPHGSPRFPNTQGLNAATWAAVMVACGRVAKWFEAKQIGMGALFGSPRRKPWRAQKMLMKLDENRVLDVLGAGTNLVRTDFNRAGFPHGRSWNCFKKLWPRASRRSSLWGEFKNWKNWKNFNIWKKSIFQSGFPAYQPGQIARALFSMSFPKWIKNSTELQSHLCQFSWALANSGTPWKPRPNSEMSAAAVDAYANRWAWEEAGTVTVPAALLVLCLWPTALARLFFSWPWHQRWKGGDLALPTCQSKDIESIQNILQKNCVEHENIFVEHENIFPAHPLQLVAGRQLQV